MNVPPAKMCTQLGDLRNPLRVHLSSERSYIYRVLEKRYFTHNLQIIIPGGVSVPHSLRNILEPYYLLRSVPLATLLEYDFLQAFVSQGQLTIVSAYASTRENSMAITPDGKLVLSVSPSLYYRLGLEATHTDQLVRKRGFDPIIKKLEFNLKGDLFYPGRKLYDRVIDAAKRCELSFDILLQWRPPETGISPESPVAYLKSRLPDLESKLCNCRYNFRQMFDVAIPRLKQEEFFDWMGVLAAGGTVPVSGEFRSSQVIVAQWTGLISRHALQNILSKLLPLLGPSPFVGLTSVGFTSDPTLRTPNAVFNMDSTLSICFEAASMKCSMFECPPL